MRRWVFYALILVNCVLGIALMVRAVGSQIVSGGLLDCCQMAGDEAFCCNQCCWFVDDCDVDADCPGHGVREMGG